MKKKPYKKVFVGWMVDIPQWSGIKKKADPILDIDVYRYKAPKNMNMEVGEEKQYRITIEEVTK